MPSRCVSFVAHPVQTGIPAARVQWSLRLHVWLHHLHLEEALGSPSPSASHSAERVACRIQHQEFVGQSGSSRVSKPSRQVDEDRLTGFEKGHESHTRPRPLHQKPLAPLPTSTIPRRRANAIARLQGLLHKRPSPRSLGRPLGDRSHPHSHPMF